MEIFEKVDLANVTAAASTVVVEWSLKALAALAILIVGRIVAGWIRRTMRLALSRAEVDPTVAPFLCSLVYYLVIAAVVVAVLSLVGIPAASLVTVVGAAGLAIGLALQGTLSNFSSGVMLLVFRPFRAGDFVEIGGSSGTVIGVHVFCTILNTGDNIQVILPNSLIYGKEIKNYSANATRRVDLVVGVSYSDDLDRVTQVLRDLVAADSRVLDFPEPLVAAHELGDSSVTFLVRPWCKTEDYWPLRWDLTRRIKDDLERNGLSIPFPQRDVHLYNPAPATSAR